MAYTMDKPIYIVSQIAQHKAKAGYSDAELAAAINAFANRGWGENYIHDLLAGKIPLSQSVDDVFRKYLLMKFYEYNSS